MAILLLRMHIYFILFSNLIMLAGPRLFGTLLFLPPNTDDNLIRRGCQIPSMCTLCGLAQETSSHLFINCPFAIEIWNWLASIINLPCNFTSVMEILKIAERNWSAQFKLVVLAAIIFCFNIIWYCRNQKRFNDKIILPRSAINLIISGTSLLVFLAFKSPKIVPWILSL